MTCNNNNINPFMLGQNTTCQNVLGQNILNRNLPLTIRKIDGETGTPLAGATFRLVDCNGNVQTGITNSDGEFVFYICPQFAYTLFETIAPEGYTASDEVFSICCNRCGQICVNGIETDIIVIPNRRILGAFTAIKVDAETDTPLAGAVYTLFSEGAAKHCTISNQNGEVIFKKLRAGRYTLSESVAPMGYALNPQVLQVVVANAGTVTIDGMPADAFRLRNFPE